MEPGDNERLQTWVNHILPPVLGAWLSASIACDALRTEGRRGRGSGHVFNTHVIPRRQARFGSHSVLRPNGR